MDWITITLVLLLIASLIAYFSGVLPYPFGLLIILALLFGRLISRYNFAG